MTIAGIFPARLQLWIVRLLTGTRRKSSFSSMKPGVSAVAIVCTVCFMVASYRNDLGGLWTEAACHLCPQQKTKQTVPVT